MKTFIVAELSANHNGSLEIAKQTILAASQAGADAVKLQTYTADTLTIDCDKPCFQIKSGTLWDGTTLYELYKKAYTPWQWHEELFSYGNSLGLTIFSTPFDYTAVDFLEELKNPIIKIASFEAMDYPLIAYAAEKMKPMVISTGVLSLDEIEKAVKTCRSAGNNDITLLVCTSQYPAKPEDAELLKLNDLKERFDVKVGLSDHTMGYAVASAAVALGASMIEKHFTLDRGVRDVDSAFSMEPSEFKQMVESIRIIEQAVSPPDYGKISDGRFFSRSLFVVNDIAEGEVFTKDNIRSIRPSDGLHPGLYPEVLGKKAAVSISRGTPLSWDLIEKSKSDNLPAIRGGKPTRETQIHYGRQYIDDSDVKAVQNALVSDYLTTGPCITEMEKRLCEMTGAKYAVAIANGTAALHAVCFAAGFGPGDEIITSPITFAASANCALYVGAKPVFADIDPETYNISPQAIEEKITENTKAVIAVDFTGQACRYDEIKEICKKHNLLLIDDAAHSIGTKYKEQNIGTLADMTTFSFHPVKTVTGGEGGAILTDNKELYDKLKLFRTHGITRVPEQMTKTPEGAWFYEQIELGYNYRLTDFQAALIISQLDKLPEFAKRRKEIVCRYNKAFSEFPELILQKNIPESDTVSHLYIIQLNPDKVKASRREIFDALYAENICPNVHYIPVYTLPYYQSLGYPKGLCPNAEYLYENILSIPLYYGMTDYDVESVIAGIRKVLDLYCK